MIFLYMCVATLYDLGGDFEFPPPVMRTPTRMLYNLVNSDPPPTPSPVDSLPGLGVHCTPTQSAPLDFHL